MLDFCAFRVVFFIGEIFARYRGKGKKLDFLRGCARRAAFLVFFVNFAGLLKWRRSPQVAVAKIGFCLLFGSYRKVLGAFVL